MSILSNNETVIKNLSDFLGGYSFYQDSLGDVKLCLRADNYALVNTHWYKARLEKRRLWTNKSLPFDLYTIKNIPWINHNNIYYDHLYVKGKRARYYDQYPFSLDICTCNVCSVIMGEKIKYKNGAYDMEPIFRDVSAQSAFRDIALTKGHDHRSFCNDHILWDLDMFEYMGKKEKKEHVCYCIFYSIRLVLILTLLALVVLLVTGALIGLIMGLITGLKSQN